MKKNHSRTLRVYTQGGGILEPSNLRVWNSPLSHGFVNVAVSHERGEEKKTVPARSVEGEGAEHLPGL